MMSQVCLVRGMSVCGPEHMAADELASSDGMASEACKQHSWVPKTGLLPSCDEVA